MKPVSVDGPLGHVEIRLAGQEAVAASLPDLIRSLPPARSLRIVANGRVDDSVIAAALAPTGGAADDTRLLSLEFVLDRDADACAAVRSRSTSLGPILAQSRFWRNQGLTVRWWIPILPDSAYRLEALFSLAADEAIDVLLVPAAAAPVTTDGPATLDADGWRFVRDFIAYRLLGEQRPHLSAVRARFYESIHDWSGSPRSRFGQHLPTEKVSVVEPDRGCAWRVRSETSALVRVALAAATAEATSAGGTARRHGGETLADVAGVLGEGMKALAQWAWTAAVRPFRAAPSALARPAAMERVLVIGAYGGDHIGDTAILGGVLLRAHRQYGTRQAILLSQRPAHSRRLVAMLDLPVTVTVEEYRQSTAGALLAQVHGVLFAGGPLMDLPKQLVKHLYTVSLARRDGKPFIIEGIGAGPFVRRPSAWTARLLVRMADRITVRTAADRLVPLVRDLDPAVGRDPAFDYLETRGRTLTRLPDVDRRWAERLLRDTTGRVTIAINLRPLRPDYTAGVPAGERADYTRAVEARFEAALADAMRRFQTMCPLPPCFIFFPMNAIQFGSSDLRSAYRVARLVGGDVDFRVWESDPSIDGVVALLRRVDLAITMRFHATIYALSQETPVVGIDYRPGQRDKVSALLSDSGRIQHCGRIDEITSDWLVNRLNELTSAASAARAVPARSSGGSSLRRAARPVPM